MASSSSDPDSLVTLHFHDFRVERMRHWWTLLGEDDHADIVGIFGKFPPFMRLQVDRGLLEALASFWDPTHCCFSIGEVDLVPTLEEYAELLQLDSPFSETPVIPIQGPRSNRCLEKYLGLTTAVLRPEIARPEETWRKANISLDLLTKYFSRSDFPVKLARDFIAGKKGWKKFRINAFKIAFAGIFLFPTSAGRIDLGVIPLVFSEGRSIIPAILCETVRSLSYCRRQGEGVPMFCTQLLQLWFCSHLRHFYRLQTPYHFERHTVSQTVNIALPFTGNSRDWALYLLDLPLGEWSWKVTWGPAVWRPWTHCALFDGVPLPGVWGCTGYYPSLALRQFGGVQYPPRLGDLDAVTFDYIPSEDMWRLLSRVEVIWEGRLSEAHHILWCLALFGCQPPLVSLRELLFWSESLRRLKQSCYHYALPGQSEREASAARVESLRSTLHHNSVAVANLRRDLEAQRGNVSTLRTMNEFIREQLEISEDAKEQLEETLAETREQLETEQAERTRVQDELDSLRSYTQALVDPATGRPQDIVALRRALDASEEALTSARTSMGAMREGFPVVTALHQINQVMDSLGARARAVLEEHDEGDPALSTAFGEILQRDLHTSWSLDSILHVALMGVFAQQPSLTENGKRDPLAMAPRPSPFAVNWVGPSSVVIALMLRLPAGGGVNRYSSFSGGVAALRLHWYRSRKALARSFQQVIFFQLIEPGDRALWVSSPCGTIKCGSRSGRSSSSQVSSSSVSSSIRYPLRSSFIQKGLQDLFPRADRNGLGMLRNLLPW
uniref:DUF7745 domain-containing protein n=1 Tax=Fagus sylvatica TaxID=28930 RepID=A0A2N9IC35_FAGSY